MTVSILLGMICLYQTHNVSNAPDTIGRAAWPCSLLSPSPSLFPLYYSLLCLCSLCAPPLPSAIYPCKLRFPLLSLPFSLSITLSPSLSLFLLRLNTAPFPPDSHSHPALSISSLQRLLTCLRTRFLTFPRPRLSRLLTSLTLPFNYPLQLLTRYGYSTASLVPLSLQTAV